MKKLLSMALVMLLIVTSIPFTVNAATAHSQSEAVSWAQSQVGKALDYDGAYGAQCVDLIYYYYQYLGVSPVGGNACNYVSNSLPSGWQRITNYSGFVPQPGDIVVWGSNAWLHSSWQLTKYGHVGIVTSGNSSTFSTVEQNVSGQYCQTCSRPTSYATCFIRPDFSTEAHTCDMNGGYLYFLKSHPHPNCYKCSVCGEVIVDGNSSNYYSACSECNATITPGTYFIKNKATGTYLNVSYGIDANEQNVDVNCSDIEYGKTAIKWDITESASTGGYMLRALCCSSRVLNVYADTVVSGKNVCIYDNTNDGSQRWYFEATTGGYIIRNVQNSSCVLDTDGSNVLVSTYHGGSSQIWSLVPTTTYTISYNANGGSGAPASQTKYYDQAITLSSTVPTRTGYSFLGWSTSSTATSATYSAGASYTSNASITLYAVWKPNSYTVTFNVNGGSGAPENQVKTHDVELELSSIQPIKEGCTFIGWNTKADGSGTSYEAGALYNGNSNVTLYAQWNESSGIFVFKIANTTAYYYDIDTKYEIAVPAQFVEGRTLVPLREVSTSIGITDLNYEASTGKITFTSFDGYTVEMKMASTTATLTKDGVTVTETVTAPVFVDGVAMLPLRDTANFTGGTVKYDASGYVVVSAGEVEDANIAEYIKAYVGWVLSLPSYVTPDTYEIETRTEYRYRTKSTTTGTTNSKSGWTLFDSQITGWGNWSNWQNSALTASESRQVETKYIQPTYKTVYCYNRWYGYSGGICYSSYGSGVWSNYQSIELDYQLPRYTKYDADGHAAYQGPKEGISSEIWWNQTTKTVQVTAGYNQYRYRDAIYTYYFYQWSDWSDWSTTEQTSSSDKEVETRTAYRYIAK